MNGRESTRASLSLSSRLFLHVIPLIAGMATMTLEMSASRLLAPYFGNSLPVWGVIIAMLLAFLAIGNELGGRLAERWPQLDSFLQLPALAGVAVGLIPSLANPMLRTAMYSFARYDASTTLAALFASLLLFAPAVVLLGAIVPFAVRITTERGESSGVVAGRLYALSTVGSLIGTFVSVFVLIPSIGTRRTIVTVSVILLTTAIIGLARSAWRIALIYLLLLACIITIALSSSMAIKPTQGLVYEADSAYNYIQVIQSGPELLLKLNEGEGIQSSYIPGETLTGYFYDYFLLVPYFRKNVRDPPLANLCLIGLAAGTSVRQFTDIFGAIPIDGVEIDPTIVTIGRQFFDMKQRNLRVFAEDGRFFLAQSGQHYDVILVDAYNPPYIPFHLTTMEFFQLTSDHLDSDGVMAINVARTEHDRELAEAIAATLSAVYPAVYTIDTVGELNSLVIASKQQTDLGEITAKLHSLADPMLQGVVSRAAGRIHRFDRSDQRILTDDLAPVEQLVHSMVARFLLEDSR